MLWIWIEILGDPDLVDPSGFEFEIRTSNTVFGTKYDQDPEPYPDVLGFATLSTPAAPPVVVAVAG